MRKFFVAAVRDWPEDRMRATFDHVLELGTQKAFTTRDYKTVKGLIRYRIQNHILYHSHVWAIFRVIPGNYDREEFVGLEYNYYDDALCDIAARYMKVRNSLLRNGNRTGYPLSALIS